MRASSIIRPIELVRERRVRSMIERLIASSTESPSARLPSDRMTRSPERSKSFSSLRPAKRLSGWRDHAERQGRGREPPHVARHPHVEGEREVAFALGDRVAGLLRPGDAHIDRDQRMALPELLQRRRHQAARGALDDGHRDGAAVAGRADR